MDGFAGGRDKGDHGFLPQGVRTVSIIRKALLTGAYAQTLQEAGVMVSGNGLHLPQTGTTLRLQDGQRQIQDGPYPQPLPHVVG
ncbi:YciI family protein [Candidatus Cyanaurora vandensis]|uniref:YciI family protein n=1 Tax=Candidatus Cyanaurora vandensis TaxID=2714958 RepID=UPI00257F9B69|nr:hypothetical protein [Candidatus Cyanaurora vandensis]